MVPRRFLSFCLHNDLHMGIGNGDASLIIGSFDIIGMVIGAAFGKFVTSLVSDIIMPPIGVLLGGADFTEMFLNLSDGEYASLAAAKEAGAATINYGVFVNAVFNFLIIKQMNKMKKEEEAAPEAPKRRHAKKCC
tara:strand:+ start:72 stop:476 length:405 start_codon:yes stop_codon:yes gene_type:complete